MMRHHGFTWTTNRVTQIETLRRPVSLLEVVGLSHVFCMPVERLLAGAESVDMPDGSTVDLSVVRDALAGRGRVEERDATAEELERAEAGRQDRRKVAGSLGIGVNELDAMAYRLWGRSFWAEKEARVGDVSGLSKRSAQTKRGHSTRSMITDLREWMEQQNG